MLLFLITFYLLPLISVISIIVISITLISNSRPDTESNRVLIASVFEKYADDTLPTIQATNHKIIHQTWKTNMLPEDYKVWSQHIKEVNPEWEYVLWTDKQNRKFIETYYDWFLPTYDSYDKNIKRIDAVRYFLLYHYGGVYLDMDMTTLVKLDKYISCEKPIFGYQDTKNISIANAYMFTPKGHPLFKELIVGLEETKNKHVLQATGPHYLTTHIHKNKYEVTLYEMPFVYNVEYNKVNYSDTHDFDKIKEQYPESFCAGFWTATWIKNTLTYRIPPNIKTQKVGPEQKIPRKILKVLLTLGESPSQYSASEEVFKIYESWIITNPTYEILFYSNEDCINYLKENFSERYLEAYNKLIPLAYKTDFFRLCWLYKSGGVYTDFLLLSLLPLDEIITKNLTFLAAKDTKKECMWNGLICSTAEHPFIEKTLQNVLQNIEQNYYGKTPLDPTGPGVFGRSIKEVHPEGEYTIGNFAKKNSNFYLSVKNKDLCIQRPGRIKIWNVVKGNNYTSLWKQKNIYSQKY